MENYTNGGA